MKQIYKNFRICWNKEKLSSPLLYKWPDWICLSSWQVFINFSVYGDGFKKNMGSAEDRGSTRFGKCSRFVRIPRTVALTRPITVPAGATCQDTCRCPSSFLLSCSRTCNILNEIYVTPHWVPLLYLRWESRPRQNEQTWPT